MASWLLYGANGYTGQLIAREAIRRGLAPTLAGREKGRVGALARELGLSHRVFALDRAETLEEHLEGMALVLNCAGPFSATGAPMMDACLRARVHYLDITGEIAVFEQAHARDAQARGAGVVLCPGVGFDVVPTDCVAAVLKTALPGATHLRLGFDVRSTISPGTAKTAAEGIALGGRVRRNGRIIRVHHGYRTRRIDERAAVRSPGVISAPPSRDEDPEHRGLRRGPARSGARDEARARRPPWPRHGRTADSRCPGPPCWRGAGA